MTPSNNPNGQPLIYRIADALGVFHLVAPVDHNHTMSEVAGLESALAGKQNALTFDTTPTSGSTNPVTSGGVKAALDGKTEISRGNNGWVEVKDNGQVQIIGDQSVCIGISDMEAAVVTLENIANLQRALTNPDTTPTANSTNLVTSGGVKEAIDNAIAIRYFSAQSTAKPLIEDIFNDANLQKVDCVILNSTGSEASITDLFRISVGQILYLPDNAPTIPNGKMVLLHIYRTITQGQFMVSIGGIYTIS